MPVTKMIGSAVLAKTRPKGPVVNVFGGVLCVTRFRNSRMAQMGAFISK